MAITDVRLNGNWSALCMVRSDHEAWAVGFGPAHGVYTEDPWIQSAVMPWYDADLLYPWTYLQQASAKKMVMASQYTGVLLRTDGTVWVTGQNEVNAAFGNSLGLGSRQDTMNAAGTDYAWVQVPGLSGIVDIEAGEYTILALHSDGRLFGWGWGDECQLNASATGSSTPVQVHGLDDVIDFSAGAAHVAVIREGGTLWTWGYDTQGGLGQSVPDTTLVDHPVQVDTGVERVEAGYEHTLYRKSGGQLWGMGSGLAIGAGDLSGHSTPMQLSGPGSVTAFSAGFSWSIAINASTGRIWTVGDNGEAQLARRSLNQLDSSTWGLLEGEGGAPVQAVDVYAAPATGVYLRADCGVFAWGANSGGSAGTQDWTNDEKDVPGPAIKSTDYGNLPWTGDIIDYAQTMNDFSSNSVVLLDNGEIYQWGENLTQADYDFVDANPELWNSGLAREYPALLATIPGATRVGCISDLIYVIKSDGTLWRYGRVFDPDLVQIAAGTYTTAFRQRETSGFEQVPGMANIVDISYNGEFHVLVQDSDGKCFALGFGEYGALGLDAPHPDVTRPYRTWAPDGVEVDAAGAVAFMSGDKIQTDKYGCYCSYPPIGLHHTGIHNWGAPVHESSNWETVPPSDWFNGRYNLVYWNSSNAFPTTYTDYGVGSDTTVFVISGVAYVAGKNSSANQGDGSAQGGVDLSNNGWWYDDDLVTGSPFTLEPFAEPKPVCFKGTATPISDFIEVLSVGYSGMFLRRASGEVWGWGNTGEALGDPALPDDLTSDGGAFSSNGGWPVHVPFWDDFASIEYTFYGGLALDNDGQLWGWGDSIRAGQGYVDGSTYISPPLPVFPGEPIVGDENQLFACDDPAENGGDGGGETPPIDGRPPDTVPNPDRPPASGPIIPVPTPQSGGCRSAIDDPASCDYNVPLDPDFDNPPLPGDNFEFPDDFDFPDIEMPLIDTDFPEFPDFCGPDFGNLSDCGPAPGSAHNPGGRDRKGKRGRGIMHGKTGGNLYGKGDKTFNQDFPVDPVTGELPEDPATGEPVVPPQRSWPAGSSIMTAITTILLDLGVSPLNIVWEIGPEWDKSFGPLTFPTTTGMLDAARSLAEKLMCRIIDEGPPTNKVYIGPPTHRPQSQTFTFADVYYPGFSSEKPFSNLSHGYSSQEAVFAVKVWGPFAGSPAWAIVDTPFSRQDPSQILDIEVGPDYTFAEAQEKAFFHAALIRRSAVAVQATVPYNINYFMRDTMILHHTEDGVMETYTIFGKQSEVSLDSEAHVLTGVLPATLAELDQFPELLPDPQPLEAAFLDWPMMRAATKRKGERRLNRHLRIREQREERRAVRRERDRRQVELFKSMLSGAVTGRSS